MVNELEMIKKKMCEEEEANGGGGLGMIDDQEEDKIDLYRQDDYQLNLRGGHNNYGHDGMGGGGAVDDDEEELLKFYEEQIREEEEKLAAYDLKKYKYMERKLNDSR